MCSRRFKTSWTRFWPGFVAASLLCLGVGGVVANTTSFRTMRQWVDLSAGDGSANPYTPMLHARLQAAWAILGFVFIAGGVAIWRLQKTPFGELVSANIVQVLMQSREEHRRISRTMSMLIWQFRWPLLFSLLLAAIVRSSIIFEPIRFDEAISWRDYAIRPLWFIASYYDQPNNHVLHNLMLGINIRIFGDSLFVLRASSLIASLVTVSLVTVIAGRMGGSVAACVAGAVVASNSAFAEYSCYARGYSMLVALALTSASMLYLALKKKNRSAWAWSVICAALGLWTIPVMLYPLVFIACTTIVQAEFNPSSGASGVQDLMQRTAVMIRWSFAVVCLAVFMYLPVLIVSGPSSLLGNSYVSPQSFGNWMDGFSRNGVEAFRLVARDIPVLGLWVVVSVNGIAFVLDGKFRRLLVCVMLAGAFIGTVVVAQRVNPPPRTWLWCVPLFSIVFGCAISAVNRRAQHLSFFLRTGSIAALIATVIAIPLWHLVDRSAVRRSNEGGACRDAPVAAKFLKNYVSRSEPIVAICPAAATLDYACHRQGLASEHFAPPGDFEKSVIVVVVRDAIYHQSVDEVLRSYNFADRLKDWKRELAWHNGSMDIFRLSRPADQTDVTNTSD